MSEELAKEIVIDEAKIADLQSKIDKKVAELSNKAYAVSMSSEDLEIYGMVIEGIEWRGKESLGILEISKKIDQTSKEGIKNNVIYMGALEIEATHYFLNKFSGKGKELAAKFIKIFKSFEQALNGIGQDNKELEDLRKELAAAQQGLETA